MALCFALHVAALVLRKYRVEDMAMYVSHASSCYSAFAALGVMQQQRFWDILRHTRSLAGVLRRASRGADKEWIGTLLEFPSQERLDRAHRGAEVLGVAQALVIAPAVLGLGYDAALHGRYFAPLWPLVPLEGAEGLYVAAANSGVALLVGGLAISCYLHAVLAVSGAAAGMLRALAARLETLARPAEVAEVVDLHQRVLRLTLEMSDFFAGNLAHVMCAMFVNSILASLQVLAHDVSAVTIGMMLSAAIALAPLSYAGQEVSDASLALSTAAYHAATSGLVTLGEARALLMLMRAAGSTPALRCRGVGRLSLPGAGHTVRQYYSVINTLRNKI
ncbi:Putative odorant receptor 65b [Frankliniella fusca]|uniref:Odorant receptor 65b n=1 Tax=Frankliniella fusca TaxID=407009 RepID=A0AAE1H9S6_9NEOP|nr:Putative odorant receptor 65b [Frankliniella fusca]